MYHEGNNHVADITFGDYWGCTNADSFYNSGGVSVIFVHTEKGAALLEGVRDLKLTKTDFEHASRANPMLFRSKEKSPQRDVFAEVFAAKGLAAACRRSQTMKQRVLAVAGRWCPVWVEKAVMLVLRRR